MATFAVIDGNIVENCIVAESKEIAEQVTGKPCVEFFQVTPGWSYIDEKFVEPSNN